MRLLRIRGSFPFVIAATLWMVLIHSCSPKPSNERSPISVAIAPYQDLAMLVNAEAAGIAQKHGIKVTLVTMAWEDILPSVGSRGKTVDVGFGSSMKGHLTR
jgi:ABC-type nitrate/sulfonate/bicarbonate transport system substrate-binding protein